MLNVNPAALFDAIEAAGVAHPKTFGRLGVSRPTGFTVLGLAATGRLDELAKGESEGSVADRIMTGDELADLPAECVWSRGSGKAQMKISSYALIGMHVAAQVGFGDATLKELGKLPGTSASQVQKLLAELPTMAEYRKEIEARRKAAAKRAADVAAVRQVVEFAERFKVTPAEEHFADAMKARDLTWPQVQEIVASLAKEPEANTDADADEPKADESKATA
ncbi:hypothetical protein [Nonomuraea sp. NPDC049504]|uniref:hypothetical protein n=1 Tax=Nonomuraea sp. NPDC049504 TaxID=3154729 RepID=UPI00341F3709